MDKVVPWAELAKCHHPLVTAILIKPYCFASAKTVELTLATGSNVESGDTKTSGSVCTKAEDAKASSELHAPTDEHPNQRAGRAKGKRKVTQAPCRCYLQRELGSEQPRQKKYQRSGDQ
jgi:hypothetical protein